MFALFRTFLSRLHALFISRKLDSDFDREIQSHLALLEEENTRSGMSPEEARYSALRSFGGVTQVKESNRKQRTLHSAEVFLQDLRYAARTMRKNLGFSVTAALILAIGIGAATAIFSAVDPILFEPLPYPQADRITMIWYKAPDGSRVEQAFGTYQELAHRNHVFESLAVVKAWQPSITGTQQPERLEGQQVSAGYFHALGVSPAFGRDFAAADDTLHSPHVAILSYRIWRRLFHGDSKVIGQEIKLDGDEYTVIGVMSQGFENVLSPAAELWSPLQYDMSLSAAWGHHLRIIGRLRSEISVDQARRDLDAIARFPIPEFPRAAWASQKDGSLVTLLQSDVTASVKPALLAVLGAVALVLVITIVNVTNLLLARGARRRGELAVRAALGAGKMRLLQQLVTETLLLAFAGGAVGMLVARFGLRALVALSPPGLPRAHAIHLNFRVFAFGVAITTLIGLTMGLVTALRASRTDPGKRLTQNSRQTGGDHQSIRRALVVAEVALSLILLASAGLLLRSLQRLFAIDPGFDASHLLTLQVQTVGHKFDKDATDRFFSQALEKVRAIPGVSSAAFTSQLPLSGDDDEYGARFEGDDPNLGYNIFRYAITPGYFETARIPLRRGRLLENGDKAGATLVLVISESLAQKRFRGEDAIGHRVHVGPANGPWFTIVGVVGDVKQTSLGVNQPDAVYLTTTQSWFVDSTLSLVVRARGDAAQVTPAVKDAIWSVDKEQPIARAATMESLLAASEAQRRFALIIFAVFALVSLALVATGIYGVLSGSVTERTREIGLRSALGASKTDILSLILRQGLTLTAIGIVIGLFGAMVASRAIASLLFGISRLDPVTYAGVAALLSAVSAVACWLPARRAAQVDPAITLRVE